MKRVNFSIKAMMISVMLLIPFSIFAQIKTEADVSIEKIKFADISSYMVSAEAEAFFKNEKGYAVLSAGYLYPVLDENMFNGIPESIAASAGFGKTFVFTNTVFDSDVRLKFINFGLDKINLYSLLELNGKIRKEIKGNDSCLINLVIPVSFACSVNGYTLGVGIGLEESWKK